MKHILTAEQFTPAFLVALFKRTEQFGMQLKSGTGKIWLRQRLANHLLFNVFYEPSTRTRFSFASAAHHLGMHLVETESASEFSSAIKGETLEDTIRVLCEYHPSAIVLRHHEDGAALRASTVSKVPIINAGDGKKEHPTQALLDVYTIFQKFKTLNNLTIMVGGDLAYSRTTRSLIHLMAKFAGTRFIFVSPPELSLLPDVLEHLGNFEVPYIEVKENSSDLIKDYLKHADVVYWTRLQKERIPQDLLPKISDIFSITSEHLACMKPTSILMHPLPRNREISTEVDSDHRAVYFQQPGNGMLVRMALLEWVLGQAPFENSLRYDK